MNTGTKNTLRYWITTLMLAAVMATAATAAALKFADTNDAAASQIWYAAHNDGNSNGGG